MQHAILENLRLGMTRKQVLEILGEPEAKSIGSRKYPRPMIWKYGEYQITFDYPEDGGLLWVTVKDENNDPIFLLKGQT